MNDEHRESFHKKRKVLNREIRDKQSTGAQTALFGTVSKAMLIPNRQISSYPKALDE